MAPKSLASQESQAVVGDVVGEDDGDFVGARDVGVDVSSFATKQSGREYPVSHFEHVSTKTSTPSSSNFPPIVVRNQYPSTEL